jgi:rare lipoprotein A
MSLKILPYQLRIETFGKSNDLESFSQAIEGDLKGSFSNILETSLEKMAENGKDPDQKTFEYVVKPGDTLWKIGMHLFQEDPYKIANIKNPDLIFPGQKLKIYKSQDKGPHEVVASWYGKEYHNRPTASGEGFDMFKNTLAHKTLPLGTIVKLFNPENGRMVVGKINDRGPYIKGRDVDLSYGLAEQLGFVQKGVGKLIMEII